MDKKTRAGTLLLCMALCACASRPIDAHLRNVTIQEAPADMEAPTARTKGDVAASSALRGGGGGLLVGAVFCSVLLPIAAPGCMSIVAPVAVTTGAVGSGVIGGTAAKNTDLAPPELTARLDTAASQRQLITLLQHRAGTSGAAVTADAPPARPYALSIALADLRMQRVDAGKPAQLVLLAQAQIQSAGTDKPVVWTKTYRIISTDRHSAAEWATTPDAAPIELLLDRLADRIATDLAPRNG